MKNLPKPPLDPAHRDFPSFSGPPRCEWDYWSKDDYQQAQQNRAVAIDNVLALNQAFSYKAQVTNAQNLAVLPFDPMKDALRVEAWLNDLYWSARNQGVQPKVLVICYKCGAHGHIRAKCPGFYALAKKNNPELFKKKPNRPATGKRSTP